VSAIEKLQAAILQFPQAEFETRHYFAGGMYLRELPRPRGALIVGKVHKKEHFYLVLKGDVTVSVGDVPERITAPAIRIYPAGTKRAVYANEDSICATVHITDETDVERVEDDLVEDDPTSPYLPGNVLKRPELT
jgi:mannose-6-phosphate isomerase-like protein (cupin superfamily)